MLRTAVTATQCCLFQMFRKVIVSNSKGNKLIFFGGIFCFKREAFKIYLIQVIPHCRRLVIGQIKSPCHFVQAALCFLQLATRCLSKPMLPSTNSAGNALGGALQAVKCLPLHLTAILNTQDYWSTQGSGAKLVTSQAEETEGSSSLVGAREAFLFVWKFQGEFIF